MRALPREVSGEVLRLLQVRGQGGRAEAWVLEGEGAEEGFVLQGCVQGLGSGSVSGLVRVGGRFLGMGREWGGVRFVEEDVWEPVLGRIGRGRVARLGGLRGGCWGGGGVGGCLGGTGWTGRCGGVGWCV